MDSYLVIMFLMLVCLAVIAFELHSINHKDTVINNYIMGVDEAPKGELTDEEIEEMVEAGVYRPSIEDITSYYNERMQQDVSANFNPYDDEEIQEMFRG